MVIFGLDGVVADTAVIHAKAWAMPFEVFFRERPAHRGEDRALFTDDDYLRFMADKMLRGAGGWSSTTSLAHQVPPALRLATLPLETGQRIQGR